MKSEITKILEDKAQALNDDLCFTVSVSNVDIRDIIVDDMFLEASCQLGLKLDDGSFNISWRNTYIVGEKLSDFDRALGFTTAISKKDIRDHVMKEVNALDLKSYIIRTFEDAAPIDWVGDKYFSPLAYFIESHFGSVQGWKKKIAINALRNHDRK